MSLYDHSDYKSYLNEYFQENQGRGRRSKAARAIGCSASYFSQVLHGKPDLTPEQGYLLAEHLGLDEDDRNYFLLMLQEARATHYKLKSHLKKQISEKRRTRFDLKKRLKATQSLSGKSKQTYYSAWFYSAIYVALFIPKYNDVASISDRLNLPHSLVNDVIQFLKESGLIERKGGRWLPSKRRLHLDRSSPLIRNHHMNWRSQALQSAEKNLSEDLHYSSVFAISEEDFAKIKEEFIQAIERAREVIAPSKEEEIFALTLDIFRL